MSDRGRPKNDEFDETIITLMKQGFNVVETYRLINAPYWLNGKKSVISRPTVNRRYIELRKLYFPQTVLEESTLNRLIELENQYG